MAQKISTKSENTVKVYEFLKANKGSQFTLKELASALGVSNAQILGGLTSMVKKGVLAQAELEDGDKVYKTYYVVDTEVEFELNTSDPSAMSDVAIQVLKDLQENGDAVTHSELAQRMGKEHVASVVGVVNSLAKKNLVSKEEVEVAIGEGEDATVKPMKLIHLTDAGRDYKF